MRQSVSRAGELIRISNGLLAGYWKCIASKPLDAVPEPRFLILATAPDFPAMRGVGVEIGLLVFGMTPAWWKAEWG
jgi:hypothetical protein